MAASSHKALFLRGMPTELVREAKAVAARQGKTLTAVVAEALSRSLGVADGSPPSEMARDMDWYATEHPKLVRRHAGDYIAIVERTVVDHGRDFDLLARRVFARYGHRDIFMPRVAEQVVTEVRVRSPRRAAR